jgi:hypothetical protein
MVTLSHVWRRRSRGRKKKKEKKEKEEKKDDTHGAVLLQICELTQFWPWIEYAWLCLLFRQASTGNRYGSYFLIRAKEAFQGIPRSG